MLGGGVESFAVLGAGMPDVRDSVKGERKLVFGRLGSEKTTWLSFTGVIKRGKKKKEYNCTFMLE